MTTCTPVSSQCRQPHHCPLTVSATVLIILLDKVCNCPQCLHVMGANAVWWPRRAMPPPPPFLNQTQHLTKRQVVGLEFSEVTQLLAIFLPSTSPYMHYHTLEAPFRTSKGRRCTNPTIINCLGTVVSRDTRWRIVQSSTPISTPVRSIWTADPVSHTLVLLTHKHLIQRWY